MEPQHMDAPVFEAIALGAKVKSKRTLNNVKKNENIL